MNKLVHRLWLLLSNMNIAVAMINALIIIEQVQKKALERVSLEPSKESTGVPIDTLDPRCPWEI
jgi:hypothetical protein